MTNDPQNNEPIFQLVYISQALDSLCYSDMHRILDSSRRFNSVNGITGVLIYKDGFFVQLLEGEESKVLDVVCRVVRDRRNHHLQVVHETLVQRRYFAEWSMAFKDGDVANAEEKVIIDQLFDAARDAFRPRLDLMLPLEELSARMGAPSGT